MSTISYAAEVRRKLFHLSSLWIALAIHFLDRSQAIPLFGVLTALAVILESFRHHYPLLMRVFDFVFGGMLREHERDHTFSGAVYVLLAATIVTILFPTPIAVTAFSLMVIADTAAALIGRKWGKHTLVDTKSIEGTAAFFISGCLVVLVCSWVYYGSTVFFWAGIAGAVAGTLAELFSSRLRMDDNLTITLAAATTQYSILYFM